MPVAAAASVAAGTAGATGATTACWTEAFANDEANTGYDAMAATLYRGTAVVTAARSVASWTDTAAETVAEFS